jgi:hypothetical protein
MRRYTSLSQRVACAGAAKPKHQRRSTAIKDL